MSQYDEGDKVVIEYKSIQHYAFSQDMWPDHYIVSAGHPDGDFHILLNEIDRDRKNE